MEREVFQLHPILFILPGESDFRRQIQEEGEVWNHAANGEHVQSCCRLPAKPARDTLIRNARVDEPVAKYDPSSFQMRAYHFLDVLRARGEEEQEFGAGSHLFIEKQRSNPLGYDISAGFASDADIAASSLQLSP